MLKSVLGFGVAYLFEPKAREIKLYRQRRVYATPRLLLAFGHKSKALAASGNTVVYLSYTDSMVDGLNMLLEDKGRSSVLLPSLIIRVGFKMHASESEGLWG